MTTIWSYNPTVEGWSLRWSWAESSQQKELIRTVPKIYISGVCLWEGGGSNTGVWYAKPLHHSGPLWHQTKQGVFLLQVFVWCQLPNQKKNYSLPPQGCQASGNESKFAWAEISQETSGIRDPATKKPPFLVWMDHSKKRKSFLPSCFALPKQPAHQHI